MSARTRELGISPALIHEGIADLKHRGLVFVDDQGRVSLSHTYYAERDIARSLVRRSRAAVAPLSVPDAVFEAPPHEDQRAAVRDGAQHPVSVLTGGPGCIAHDTVLRFKTSNKRNCGRDYTIEDAYFKFHRTYRKGAGRGRNRFWDGAIQTLSMAADGSIFYNKINDIVSSGEKEIFEVKTAGGRSLRASAEHPFKVPTGTVGADAEGFVVLADLAVGAAVIVRREEQTALVAVGKNRVHRREYHVPAHPHARRKQVTVPAKNATGFKTYEYWLMREATLVYEASLNRMSLQELVAKLQDATARVGRVRFLSEGLEVHHKNGDPTDNRLSNLEVYSKADHARAHGPENKFHFGNQNTEVDRIVSIERVGVQRTYDLVMEDPARNYVAGGYVVHNSGKTTTVRAMLNLFDHHGIKYVCAAPTGKAAIRMREQTGRAAATMHRLMREHTDPETGAPLVFPAGAVIIDEMSMVPVGLLAEFLKHTAPGQRIVLIGDVDQLNPIDAGRPLFDILASRVLPVTRLTKIFRQASTSSIPYIAAQVRDGQAPRVQASYPDFFWIEQSDPNIVLAWTVEAVATQAHLQMGLQPYEVQVISPQKTRTMGTEALNHHLQARMNPATSNELDIRIGGGYTARTRDRVMHTENDYTRNVFNGEIGYVVHSDPRGIDHEVTAQYVPPTEGTAAEGGEQGAFSFPALGGPGVPAAPTAKGPKALLIVQYENPSSNLPRFVAYTKEQTEDLLLAYAISCHKMQGSSAKLVVFVCHEEHRSMLTKSLIYTALTRAEKAVIVIGQESMLRRAVRNNRGAVRRTRLKDLLLEFAAMEAPREDTRKGGSLAGLAGLGAGAPRPAPSTADDTGSLPAFGEADAPEHEPNDREPNDHEPNHDLIDGVPY